MPNDYETAVELQDLRARVLAGEPVQAAEYRRIIDSIRRARTAAASPAPKARKKAAALLPTPLEDI